MENGLAARLALCIGSVFLAIWLLIPTFMGKQAQDLIEAAAERATIEDAPAPATPDPWWVGWLPNRKVNLGLDLQGGIDLTLEVETDEAVSSTVQRDIQPLKMAAEDKKIAIQDIRRDRRHPALLVSPGEGTDLEAVTGLIRGMYRYYTYHRSEEIDGRNYFVFEMTEAEQAAVADRSVDQALETIRNRVDETGVKEPVTTRKGDRGIDVQLPGETDVESAVEAIGTTAQLEFILVDEEANMTRADEGIAAAEKALPPKEFTDDERLSEWLRDNGYIQKEQRLFWQYAKDPAKLDVRVQPLVLKGDAVLTGDDVNDAQTTSNGQTGDYYVALQFKPRGTAIFADVTGANVGKRFAIVLDGKVRSAPVINERIAGTASISMGQGNIDQQLKEASTLALVLRSGALPAPVSVGEVRKVGASLGERAIEEGVMAAFLGSGLVLLFAAWYYRWSGVLADIALVCNGLFVVAMLAVAGATLTLPGICGIALTIGMAVDCNILIFERIREELRAGKGIRNAIEAGYDRASVAVLDSNITTLLAGIVLYSYGSGPIRGFAVTLMIGIFTTLYSGVFLSRVLVELANRGKRTEMSI